MTRARYSGGLRRRDLLRLGGGIAAGGAAAVLLGACGDGSKPSSKPGADHVCHFERSGRVV